MKKAPSFTKKNWTPIPDRFRIVWIGDDGREHIGATINEHEIAPALDRMVTEWRASASVVDRRYQVERQDRKTKEWRPEPAAGHVKRLSRTLQAIRRAPVDSILAAAQETGFVDDRKFASHDVEKLSAALAVAESAACNQAYAQAARQTFHCIAAMIRRACA